jgi:hypothetical protein
MNKQEAASTLDEFLKQFRKHSYGELKQMVDAKTVEAKEAVGSSGTKYQIKIQAFWDDKPGANIRVQGSIDDGGWRAFFPLIGGFIMSPDSSLIGE